MEPVGEGIREVTIGRKVMDLPRCKAPARYGAGTFVADLPMDIRSDGGAAKMNVSVDL